MISTCPVCTAELFVKTQHAGNAAWNSCWHCETQFQGPRTLQSARAATAVPQLPRQRRIPTPEEQLETMLIRFEPYRREGRLLDVCFGDGQILGAAAAEGWQCWGTETSRTALDSGRRNGWRVLSGDLCRIGLPEALFDVICMAHVLEYLEQPAAYLREAIRLLRPGGLLYLATTSVHAAEAQPPVRRQTYLQLFTTTAVRLALQTAGYTRERISVAPGRSELPGNVAEEHSATPSEFCSAHRLGTALQQLFRMHPLGERLTAFAERPR